MLGEQSGRGKAAKFPRAARTGNRCGPPPASDAARPPATRRLGWGERGPRPSRARKRDAPPQAGLGPAPVNAALMPGGGVAGAIHRAAGPGLYAECRPLAPIRPGQAVITGAHALPNRWVIHCLGPVYGVDRPEAALLAACYRQALRLAQKQGARSIAFPAISTGIFGYPKQEAAEVALGEVTRLLPLPGMALVRFVLFTAADRDLHLRVLAALAAGGIGDRGVTPPRA